MHTRFKIAVTVCLASFFSLTNAAEEFQDFIPIEVAEALFGFGAGGDMQVYADIMDDFPDFQLPAQFEVLGSADRSMTLILGLVTALDEENARSAITDAFTSEGWIEMPEFTPMMQESGFVSVNRPSIPSYRQLCHDDYGQMNVSYRDRGSRNIVTLNTGGAFGMDNRSCAERIEQQEQAMARQAQRRMGIHEYMPLLQVPEEARQGFRPFLRAGGTSSSNNSVETETSFTLDWELDELYEYFAEQMIEQGWTLDTQSIGTLTAMGMWTQATEDGENLVARLDVVNAREEQFDLTLSVERPGGRRSGVFFSN